MGILMVVVAGLCAIRANRGARCGAVAPGAREALPAKLAVGVWRRWRRIAWQFGLLVGFAWSGIAHERALALRVGAGSSRDAVPLVIRIVGDPVPVRGADPAVPAVRFLAEVLGPPGGSEGVGRRLRLSWFGSPAVLRGEVWRVAAVVRPPWGYANPGGFDYERWLFGQRIHGTGTIRRGVRVGAYALGGIERTRARLRAFVMDQPLRYAPILTAQLVGIVADVPAEQWELFRVTGTIHLMVISGLHIALAASLGFMAGNWLIRCCPPLLLRLDARKAGAWCGACCGAGYLLLAGGGAPAVRACVMAAPLLLLVAWGRRCRAGTTVLAGLAVVLGSDPLAVHQQGFWLSFAAVVLLVIGFGGRYGAGGAIGNLLRTQWLLTLCMAPLLLLLTGVVSVSGLAANLVAVPVVSTVVVPLTLAAGALYWVWPPVAVLCLRAADALLGPLFAFLEGCSRVPLLQAEPAAAVTCAALLAGGLWLLGVPRRQYALLLLGLAATVLPRSSAVAPGEFRVLGLDVGQGDAIVVDTARHRLLFDTGPAFPGGFETGSAVVVPSLLATGPGVIDLLVLSHDDLDHVGGAPAIGAALPVRRVQASFPRPDAAPCDPAEWVWDGVRFRFLDAPRGAAEPGSNDASCILLVDNGRRRALLAGDAGALVEAGLLRRLPDPLDLLFAPHHGSRTSSSSAFVRVTRPRLVFVSAGRDNRYGHPHPRVLDRYREVGAAVYVTAREGALRWESAAPDAVGRMRADRPPYWRSSGAVAGGS